MSCRDLYLRIEKVPAYSPVAPEQGEHERHMRDCMRNHGHEDARIPLAEVERRRLEALVYREYLDPGYTVPKTDPIVPNDLNEPRWDRRVPATVIYAEVGERLYVHILNADTEPHSFHIHGLVYGIDSDGSWPFGVVGGTGAHGLDRRSDAICPGEEWTYIYDVTEETVGAWPFHDHVMDIEVMTNRGLFGGIVVRDPYAKRADVEVPLFIHRMLGDSTEAAFDSGTMVAGDSFIHVFAEEGTFEYLCRFHPMIGTVRVLAAGAPNAAVTIIDSPTPRFEPNDVQIGVGGTVTWTHGGTVPHTVSDAHTSPLESMSLNGRSFVGNTPTIVAETGRRIRWYVFNLDFGELWHNFHVHGQRFRVGNDMADTRSIGPAESFVVDTIVPPVLLLPLGCDEGHPHHSHPHGKASHHGHPHPHGEAPNETGHAHEHPEGNDHGDHPDEKPESYDEPVPKTRYCLQADFPVHCHVEMHMMMGMIGLVRAIQQVELSDEEIKALGFELPLSSDKCCDVVGHDHDHDHNHGNHNHGGGHRHGGVGDCPDVHHHPCRREGEGRWEALPDLDIFVVHAALLNTGKVLLWSGTAEVGDPLESRVWDPSDDSRTMQTYGEDLFCSGHAFLPDGRLLVAGGAPSGFMNSTHIFTPSPAGGSWTKVQDMNQARWYPTVVTLPDGRILAASGSGASEVEIYDGTGWTVVAGATRSFGELYPSLHQLPSGQIFYSRCGWAMADTVDTSTAYLTLTGPNSGAWTPLGQQQFNDRQEGTAVIKIDTTVSPPVTRIFVIGGGVTGAPTDRNPQSVEFVDVTNLGPATAWSSAGVMTYPRTNVNAVVLPDGTIFIVGGQRAGKWAADPQPVLEAEILDPDAVPPTFTPTTAMQSPRQYHSVAVLLPDGRVLTAGGVDPPNPTERDLRSMEVFSPAYLDRGPQPVISNAPPGANYGSLVTVDTPDAARVESAVLIRPNSVTHHTDAGHRWILLPIEGTGASSVDVRMPADGNVAPPGDYLLFLVDDDRVPSVGRFINVS